MVIMSTVSSSGHELWQECAQWLVACGALDSAHRVTWPNAKIQEFAQILRDGVLLCHLVLRIAPGCIEQREVALRPQMSQFLCLKNICLFLGACQNQFLMKQSELFEAGDLFKLIDFAKVLQTLSRFSHCDVAKRRGVPSFPSRQCPSYPTPNDNYHSDIIYRNLEDKLDDMGPEENLYDAGENEEAETYGQIYDTIVHWTTKQASATRQKEVDKWRSFIPTQKRDFCVKELLDTEMNYVEKALEIIVNKYFSPLKDHMTAEDHSTVFMNIVELYSIHKSFYHELRRAVMVTVGLEQPMATETITNLQIGEVFLAWKDKFVAYGQYCSHLPASRSRIEQFDKENGQVRQAIKQCSTEANSCLEANRNQFLLQDLLTVPMQRVLKYHVLLTEMIKLTSIDSDDRLSLEEARQAMQDINVFINEVKRDYEMKQVIADIQKSIVDLEMHDNMTLLDYGRLVKDGELKIADHAKDGSRMKNRYVFIFDKVMLICKNTRANQFTYKSAHVLSEYRIETDAENNNRFGTIGRKLQNNQSCFSLVHEKMQNVLNMSAKTPQQKDQWVQHLEMASDNVNPKSAEGSGHVLRVTSFESATACTHCQKLLAGMFHQGYFCEVCECALHKVCIAMHKCTGKSSKKKLSMSQLAATTRSLSKSSLMTQASTSLNAGEWATAIQSYTPSDPRFLSFDKDDVIEVVEVFNDGTIKGRLRDAPRSGTGLVTVDYLRKMRTSVVNPQPLSGRRRTSALPLDQCVLPAQVKHRDSLSSIRSTNGNESVDSRDGEQSSSTTSTTRYSPPIEQSGAPATCYENTAVIGQPWYQGQIDRDEAQRRLVGADDGTFLVRYSANVRRFAISVSYEGEVKHAKIEQLNDKYFLDETKAFDSVVELINYYRTHNLRECFDTLNTQLREPLRGHKFYRAMHNYEATEEKFLSLKKDDIVTLIDTQGEQLGWWRGQIGNRTGFFPISYVEPAPNMMIEKQGQ